MSFDLSVLFDPKVLAMLALLILSVAIISYLGAVVFCDKNLADSNSQSVFDNGCQSFLNMAKSLPIIGELGGS